MHWGLLLFLLLVLNVKLIIKAAALLVFIIVYRNQIRKVQPFRQQYLLFYSGVIIIGIINLFLMKQIQSSYFFVAGLGVVYWLMAAVAGCLALVFVKTTDPEKIHKTLTLFFCLHMLVIVCSLILIIIETGSINPYTYRGFNQKYYISTGDFLKGITMDSPVTTAFISSFGVLYFLYRNRLLLSILCMACFLAQVSNLTNFMLLGALLFCFLFQSTKMQKSIIVIHLLMMAIFFTKISPQNTEYVADPLYKLVGLNYYLLKQKKPAKNIRTTPDSLLTLEEKKMKLALKVIDSMSYFLLAQGDKTDRSFEKLVMQYKTAKSLTDPFYIEYREASNITIKKKNYTEFIRNNYTTPETDTLQKKYNWEKQGKLIAYSQVIDFFKEHPEKTVFGTGIGNFSSRLAFKATGLGIAGSYPSRFHYIHPYFRENHLFVYLYYHTKGQTKHAVVNTPDAVYSQLAGEYGFAGLLIFFFLYLGYFIKRTKRLTYGVPLMLMLLGGFFIEYWFEQLSIVILFEFLMLLDINEGTIELPDKKN